MSGEPGYRFGPFRLDRRRRRLYRGDEPLHLKPKEFELLCCLVDHRDRVLSKEELLDRLWPRQTVTEANLSQAVYAVRKALGDSARRPRWIESSAFCTTSSAAASSRIRLRTSARTRGWIACSSARYASASPA